MDKTFFARAIQIRSVYFMKNVWMILGLLFLPIIGMAQSKTTYAERQENPLNKLLKQPLPDLTFLAPPVLTGKGDGIELSSKNGTWYASVPVEFVVTNIGAAVSKTALMVAQVEIRKISRPGRRPESDSVTLIESYPFGVEYIKPNGVVKVNKMIEFVGVPYLGDHPVPSIYSKQIKLRIIIMQEGYGSQKEQSIQNNISADVVINYME